MSVPRLPMGGRLGIAANIGANIGANIARFVSVPTSLPTSRKTRLGVVILSNAHSRPLCHSLTRHLMRRKEEKVRKGRVESSFILVRSCRKYFSESRKSSTFFFPRATTSGDFSSLSSFLLFSPLCRCRTHIPTRTDTPDTPDTHRHAPTRTDTPDTSDTTRRHARYTRYI
jgi:hypothetical protein